MARTKAIKIPRSARGDYHYVWVQGADKKKYRVLTRFIKPTHGLIEFVPSNEHKARTLGGVRVLTHPDIWKGHVFPSLETRAEYVINSRKKFPEIKFYPADIIKGE